MTVKELIEFLQTVPEDAVVCRKYDEYQDGEIKVQSAHYRVAAGFGISENSVLII